MGIFRLILYITAFAVLALASNLIVTTISSFSKRVRIPPFVFSFFVVGLLTSVGEIAVAINAVSIHQPEIFVGSLLGGTLVIFLLVIPLTAILTKGIRIKQHLSLKNLLVVLGIIATPAVFTLDRTVTNMEGFLLIVFYIALFYIIRAPRGALTKVEAVFKKESKSLRENTFLRLGMGGLLVFLSSRFIVEQTVVYSDHYHVSTFLVSLVFVAIGMNLPELSLAIHAALGKQAKVEDIAIGDFLGSAAANVVLFGIFTLINNGDVITSSNFTSTFLFIALALIGFFAFTRGKHTLTSREGFVLISLYGGFVAVKFIAG
jgi:cation:H+ antiporter